uniref:Uncharacterized protein n=1 Tax=Amphimedon queenslandica TaxID=400682 RepID=A0A1X7U054_AMPQE
SYVNCNQTGLKCSLTIARPFLSLLSTQMTVGWGMVWLMRLSELDGHTRTNMVCMDPQGANVILIQ